jgi:hypothetical protein
MAEKVRHEEVLRKGAIMTDRTISDLPWVTLYSGTVVALILLWAS